MVDHTFDGVPVREMPRQKIYDCLADGVTIRDGGPDDEEARQWVMLRLEIELTIRSILGETH